MPVKYWDARTAKNTPCLAILSLHVCFFVFGVSIWGNKIWGENIDLANETQHVVKLKLLLQISYTKLHQGHYEAVISSQGRTNNYDFHIRNSFLKSYQLEIMVKRQPKSHLYCESSGMMLWSFFLFRKPSCIYYHCSTDMPPLTVSGLTASFPNVSPLISHEYPASRVCLTFLSGMSSWTHSFPDGSPGQSSRLLNLGRWWFSIQY